MPRLSTLALLGGLCVATTVLASDTGAQEIVRDSLSLPGGPPLPPLPPLEAGKSRARVTGGDGRRDVGWVVAVDDTSLALNPDERPYDLWYRRRVTFDRRRLLKLELSERPRWRAEATALGFLGGALLGGLVGSARGGNCPPNAWGPCGRDLGLAAGVMLGASIGGLLGRHVVGRDRWREIDPVAPPAEVGVRNPDPGTG